MIASELLQILIIDLREHRDACMLSTSDCLTCRARAALLDAYREAGVMSHGSPTAPTQREKLAMALGMSPNARWQDLLIQAALSREGIGR